ncbi:hypothetical protein F5B19DRAFT_486041 [Rostrohypoxylon terebratum]|nr:hypothetical protein F5B19DRAFT_486041 [Rostrohypoxylon terebratum]
MSTQDLARCLAAAGYVKLPDNEGGGIYILSVRDGYLVEKHWVGDTILSENVIAENVKDNTTASYLISFEEDLRLVVFIDQENTIQCCAYNEDIEEWEETPLGSKWNVETTLDSKLSATIGPEGEIVISYQDVNGRLAGIRSAGKDEWKAFGPLDGNPILGTPQCLEVVDDTVYLFYVEEHAGIGYLALDPSTPEWKASLLPNTKFDTVIDNFSVTKDLDTGNFQSYILTGGALWSVDGAKEKTFLGNVDTTGRLILSDKAQAGFRLKWWGARKLARKMKRAATMEKSSQNSSFKLPEYLYHSDQKNEDISTPERFGIDLMVPARRWEGWVVKLTFEKLGEERHGNGFYVNVPNPNFDVILTAGHNLVDKPEHYCSNIRIIHDPCTKEDIPVTPGMIRVCPRYFEDPNELNAIYDYGIILLQRGKKSRHRGFGFHLMLGENTSIKDEKDILQDSSVYVSGYMPGDSPPNSPSRSQGTCIRATSKQLHYTADTIQGMSGGPVWVGFRGVETVVAVHNYGFEKKGQGNRGSRLNLDVWHTIFNWINIGWHDKSLYYRGSEIFTMHLHIPRDPNSDNKPSDEGKVRVGQPGLVETSFDILPVSARPQANEVNAVYGFSLRPLRCKKGSNKMKAATSPPIWVRWDPMKGSQGSVSTTKRFDVRCEVKITTLIAQPGKPFAIQVQCGESLKQVCMGMDDLDDGALLMLEDSPQSYEDTSEITFIPSRKDKLFEFR